MKTGKVSKALQIDPKTVTGWTDTFAKFFSPDSQLRPDNKQRNYTPDDLIMLNTILTLRNRGISMEDIRLQLEAGYRDEELPPDAFTIGGEQAMTIYAQLKQYQTELAILKDQLEKSEQQRQEERAEFERQRKEERAELEQLYRAEREASQTRVEKLLQEMAVLKYRLEQLEGDDNDSA